MTSLTDLKEGTEQAETDLGTVGTAQMTLMENLGPVMESFLPLMSDIDDLMSLDDPFGINSALLADYFTVNESEIALSDEMPNHLGSFCVEP